MSEFSQIGDRILNEVLELFQLRGLEVREMRPENGELVVRNAGGRIAVVNLIHLVEYYYETRDENAVGHFVDSVAASLTPRDAVAWEAARKNIYYSLHPTFTESDPPFAREVTAYCARHYILDTPDANIWITPNMLEEWGVSEEAVNRQALENGDRLLAGTELDIDNIKGCALGSFHVRDVSLKAALLLAPSFKDKVSPHFGWPVYAVIPNKRLCCFFRKSDYPALKSFISNFVGTYYEESQHVSPELLEFGPHGISSVCTWLKKGNYIMEFDS